MSATFSVSIVTPARAILECEATFVALPAHDGEIGILRNRAPLLCKLDVGKLRIDTPEGDHVFLVDGGFAEVSGNSLTILTESAMKPDEIDPESAQTILAEAREMKVRDDASLEERERAFKRARMRKRLGS